ncbi:MAG: hypothetical protein NZ898_14355 [Myxococcota bacterium]|nr:hypothetical protein [Myxococcota bacterium]MDW8360853.1 hypothetical protein [Myxococcales bacterium]
MRCAPVAALRPQRRRLLWNAAAETLERWPQRARAVRAWLEEHDVEEGRLEASVRWRPGVSVRGGRLMVERVEPRAALALLDVLAGPGPEGRRAAWLVEQAASEGVHVIVGWDAAADGTLRAKVYANASDAAESVRVRLAGRCAGRAAAELAPSVVGINVGGGRAQLKVYVQRACPPASPPPEVARAFEQLARADRCAGYVTAFDVLDESCGVRAWFAALRPVPWGSDCLRVSVLGPRVAAAIARAAPFAPGLASSLGASADGSWTLYFRPAGAHGAPWQLEPSFLVRGGATELGVYVEPWRSDEPCYARVGPWAVSYRVRSGRPEGRAVARVLAALVARLREVGWPSAPAALGPLPYPWTIDEGFGDARGPVR